MKKILIFSMMTLFSCGNVVVETELKQGFWFGQNTSMDVNASGAELEFTCARAVINSRILLNERSSFVLNGTYYQQYGIIPIGHDASQDIIPARFEAVLVGDELQLKVYNAKTNNLLSSANLKIGERTIVRKCA